MGFWILDFGFWIGWLPICWKKSNRLRRVGTAQFFPISIYDGLRSNPKPKIQNPKSIACLLCLLTTSAATAQPYTRLLATPAVLDDEGVSYSHPWLGGLNVPRPQLLDIDADGDLDLFVQERPGSVMFFENTGSAAAHRFVWRTDAFDSLAVNEWARFADVDGDGDFDVLAEEPFSFVRYFRNDGTREAASFRLAADTLKDATGVPLFSDRQNLPALADIDCDGLLDLFIADLNGFLTYYANEGVDADSLPRFRFVTDRYENLEIVGGFGKKDGGLRMADDGSEKHGANAIDFADIDGDGDEDLFWGDFFSPSLYFIENTGSCETPKLELITDLFPIDAPMETRGYNVPLLADIDADGDVDLFAGVLGGAFAGGPEAAANLYFYRHDDSLRFSLQTRQFISSLDVDEESMPAFADLDDDGDFDLVVGNRIAPNLGQRAQLFLFENIGTPATPAFRLMGDLLNAFDPARTDRIFNIAPAFADIDGDGDADLLLGRFDGSFVLLENTGTPQQAAFALVDPGTAPLFAVPTIDIGQNSTPAFIDLDGDGDLDLVVGEAAGTFNVFRNTGTPPQPRLELEAENIGGLDVGARSMPAFHDADGDGLPDLIAGTSQDGVRVYRNTSTPQTASFAFDGPLVVMGTVPPLAAPAFADLDADGDADLILGGLSGGLFYYRNDAISTATEASPVRPRFSLSNYPNPFRDATTLRFHLPQATRVRLAVYDMLGRRVAVPLDSLLPAGDHAAPFDARALPAGVYLYRLTTDDGTTASGAMLRVR